MIDNTKRALKLANDAVEKLQVQLADQAKSHISELEEIYSDILELEKDLAIAHNKLAEAKKRIEYETACNNQLNLLMEEMESEQTRVIIATREMAGEAAKEIESLTSQFEKVKQERDEFTKNGLKVLRIDGDRSGKSLPDNFTILHVESGEVDVYICASSHPNNQKGKQ